MNLLRLLFSTVPLLLNLTVGMVPFHLIDKGTIDLLIKIELGVLFYLTLRKERYMLTSYYKEG